MPEDRKERLMLAEEAEVEVPPGLELRLGLNVQVWKRSKRARILTAQDLLSCPDGSPTSARPIRAYRMNSLVNISKGPRADDEKSAAADMKTTKDGREDKVCEDTEANETEEEGWPVRFVKVYMDGVPIGRKVDLNAHSRYHTLARTLADMFLQCPDCNDVREIGTEGPLNMSSTSLLNDLSEFVLTYEDKEGDWMLVVDVPWGTFRAAIRRLKIMRTSEAKGLDSRFQQRNEKGRRKPV